MKTKLTLLVFMFLAGIGNAGAQITEGVPSAKKIRVGNRPVEGNFGLYMGASSNMLKGIFDENIKISALPLINLKYMATDQFELRLGVEFYETSERLKGDYTDGDGSVFSRVGESNGLLSPGIAYHFSKSNIFDVYVGAELPLGWDGSFSKSKYESGDNYSSKISKNAFQIGLGAFIGLQVFVANLPLALGVEYGISSRFDAGLKYKNEITENGKTQTYYTSELSESYKDEFDKLKAKKGTIGNQVRLTLSYYFK